MGRGGELILGDLRTNKQIRFEAVILMGSEIRSQILEEGRDLSSVLTN